MGGAEEGGSEEEAEFRPPAGGVEGLGVRVGGELSGGVGGGRLVRRL